MLGSNAPCQFTCASTKVWLRMQHDLYTNLLPDLSILSAGIISLLPISCECTTSVSRPLWLDSGVGETCPCQRRGTPTVKSPEPVVDPTPAQKALGTCIVLESARSWKPEVILFSAGSPDFPGFGTLLPLDAWKGSFECNDDLV